MIIGFILGPLLESAFDQTMTLSDGSFMIFLTHPFSVVLLLLTVAAVFSIARARLPPLEDRPACAGRIGKDEIWGGHATGVRSDRRKRANKRE